MRLNLSAQIMDSIRQSPCGRALDHAVLQGRGRFLCVATPPSFLTGPRASLLCLRVPVCRAGRSKEWRRGRVVFNEVEVACRIHGQRQVGSCPNVPVTVWHERCKLETKMRHAHLSTVSKLNAASPGLQGRSKEWHRVGWCFKRWKWHAVHMDTDRLVTH